MRKLRNDYNWEKHERLYRLNKEFGLSVNEIALNSLHNSEKLSMQRIYQLIQEHERILQNGRHSITG
jgi:transposase